MVDRREDGETRDRLEQVIGALELETKKLEAGRKANRRSITWLVRGFVILAVGNTFAVCGVIYVANQVADRIQQSRRESLIASCEERNARNKAARVFLQGLPADPDQNQDRATRERLLTGFTDALVGPVENCVDRADNLTDLKP